MSLSDSLFLFDIKVRDLLSYIDCKEFYVRCQFADIFNVYLKDPNEIDTILPKKKSIKQKVRNIPKIKKPHDNHKTSQSILFESSIESLRNNMKSFPIELSLWSKDDPENKLGSTHIPWSPVYYEYLNTLTDKNVPHPAFVSGGYNVFDEVSSKRMAIIRLNVKLKCIRDTTRPSFHALFEDKNVNLLYSGLDPKYTTIWNTHIHDTGVIKTTYSGGKRNIIPPKKSKKKIEYNNKVKDEVVIDSEKTKIDANNEKDRTFYKEKSEISSVVNLNNRNSVSNSNLNKEICEISSSNVYLKIKKSVSNSDINKTKLIEVRRSLSHCLINRDRFNMLNYIYGSNGPFRNNVFCIGYFTVENKSPTPSDKSERSPSPLSTKSAGTRSDTAQSPEKTPNSEKVPNSQTTQNSNKSQGTYKFKVCNSGLSQTPGNAICSQSPCSLDLPEAAADFITVKKCTHVDCDQRKFNEPPSPPDDRVLLDLTHMYDHQCGPHKLEEISGKMKGKLEMSEGSCFCTCECSFGFVKKTTYCKVCGGFEKVGEDFSMKPPNMPFPCPIYHKITKPPKPKQEKVTERGCKKHRKMKDDRFKFNYGYTGIPPRIGHSQCAMPCTGTLGPVPKNMGWLWTAENVPGMKFRPLWRPGAANKHVVRMLRIARNPGEVVKKRRRDTSKKKRPLKRPLLIVQKKEGEYTVTMETMKQFSKPRTINQYPYEDKPVLTYTIGRTEEENIIRRKKKERIQRRLEREQREFIQSAFRDMCKEICLKTYQQALGILKDAEDPECLCYPVEPGPERINMEHSCSCSEDKSYVSTDTDSDEWIVEFTPPNATFNPAIKPKRIVKADHSTQYTYMDYRVKLMDRYGNPVPRFFKGPDGKTQCSDLGGFWSPDNKWLEINIDGYIAPDERWAPYSFIGPNGEQIDIDNGKFQSDGRWLMVGIDGFIDVHGKWKFYPKPKGVPPPEPKGRETRKKKEEIVEMKENKNENKPPYKPSEPSWSCFGDITPKALSKLGIIGHGQDKKMLLRTLQEMLEHGEDVKLPEPYTVPYLSPKKGKGKYRPDFYDPRTYFSEREKCRHPVPSEKGIIAVDDHGNKTYFRLKDYKNLRSKDRMIDLTKQGISVSSFHVPCLSSFINAEMMKKQLYERRYRMAGIEEYQDASTQVGGKDMYGPYTRHLHGIA